MIFIFLYQLLISYLFIFWFKKLNFIFLPLNTYLWLFIFKFSLIPPCLEFLTHNFDFLSIYFHIQSTLLTFYWAHNTNNQTPCTNNKFGHYTYCVLLTPYGVEEQKFTPGKISGLRWLKVYPQSTKSIQLILDPCNFFLVVSELSSCYIKTLILQHYDLNFQPNLVRLQPG